MIFGDSNDNDYYVLTMRQEDNLLRLAAKKTGVWTTIVTDVSRTLSLGTDYTLEVRVQGSTINVYFNGEVTPAFTYVLARVTWNGAYSSSGTKPVIGPD